MNLEIERYLNGEMSASERLKFEQRLLEDPELQKQTEESRLFLDRLKNQLLREKIQAIVGKENPGNRSAGSRSKWFWLAGLILLLLIFSLLWLNRSASEDLPDLQLKPQESVPAERRTEDAADPPRPSVQEPEPARPAGGSKQQLALWQPQSTPGRRGLAGTSGGEWNQRVQSVWQTRFSENPEDYGPRYAAIVALLREKQFPDAYVQLQLLDGGSTPGDTLAFLRGYCLLEMREGEDALVYFDSLSDGKLWQQQMEWYRVLAHLLEGDLDKARERAAIILKEENHDFYDEAVQFLNEF